MPIQFRCTHCSKPIEVDDEFAEQQAACPFCEEVVTVPATSTYNPHAKDQVPVATPINESPSATESETDRPPAVPLPPATPPLSHSQAARRQTALMLGNYALVLAGITLLLFLVHLALGIIAMTRIDQPTDATSLNEAYEQLQSQPEAAYMQAAHCGMLFFALIGAALAVTSLTQAAKQNWRAWVAISICGGLLMCVCVGIAVSAALLGGGVGG